MRYCPRCGANLISGGKRIRIAKHDLALFNEMKNDLENIEIKFNSGKISDKNEILEELESILYVFDVQLNCLYGDDEGAEAKKFNADLAMYAKRCKELIKEINKKINDSDSTYQDAKDLLDWAIELRRKTNDIHKPHPSNLDEIQNDIKILKKRTNNRKTKKVLKDAEQIIRDLITDYPTGW